MADNCKIQVSFKTGPGFDAAMVNLYANTADELKSLLDLTSRAAARIQAVNADLQADVLDRAAQNVQQGLGGQEIPPQAPPTPPADPWGTQGDPWATATPAPPAQPQGQRMCSGNHGPAVYKEGMSKTGKPYKGWFCPSNAQGCAPQWG